MSKPKFKVTGFHAFGGKLLNWQYCQKCGLITLKNENTQKAIQRACPGKEEE
jgi:hypothetical protein